MPTMRMYWRPVLWVLAVIGALFVLGVVVFKLIALLIPVALITAVVLIAVPYGVRKARDESKHS